MMFYYQETASRATVAVPATRTYRFALQPPDETIGRKSTFVREQELTEPARRAICQIENEDVLDKAMQVLALIHEEIINLQRLGVVLDHLPPLHAASVEDGSVLIEWAFPDFRVGFSVEPGQQESSWYLVSNQRLGDIGASGYATSGNLKSIVVWLFSVVLSNS